MDLVSTIGYIMITLRRNRKITRQCIHLPFQKCYQQHNWIHSYYSAEESQGKDMPSYFQKIVLCIGCSYEGSSPHVTACGTAKNTIAVTQRAQFTSYKSLLFAITTKNYNSVSQRELKPTVALLKIRTAEANNICYSIVN